MPIEPERRNENEPSKQEESLEDSSMLQYLSNEDLDLLLQNFPYSESSEDFPYSVTPPVDFPPRLWEKRTTRRKPIVPDLPTVDSPLQNLQSSSPSIILHTNFSDLIPRKSQQPASAILQPDRDSGQDNIATKPPQQEPEVPRLTIVLDTELREFTKDEQELLLTALADILGVKRTSLQVSSIESGSVKVTIEIPSDLTINEVVEVENKVKERPELKHLNPTSVSRESRRQPQSNYTILFLAANPTDQTILRLDKEYKLIEHALVLQRDFGFVDAFLSM